MSETAQEQEVHVHFEILHEKEKLATLDKILWVAQEGEKAPSKSIHDVVGSLVSKVQEKCGELDVEIQNKRQVWIEALVAVLTLAESTIHVEVVKKPRQEPKAKSNEGEEKTDA